jgi:hypothetical protein
MEIENLRRAALAALRQKYREVFGEETRSRHREHLFRRIAWRLQALAEGDLSERARARAQQIARDADLRMLAPLRVSAAKAGSRCPNSMTTAAAAAPTWTGPLSADSCKQWKRALSIASWSTRSTV